MKDNVKAYLKKNALLIALLAVGVLILVALILNLLKGGLWIVTGMNGKNAYELAVEEGFKGTRQEWLNSLYGEDGTNGVNGTNGVDGLDGQNGANGKSAYQLACEEGFEGSLQEWLLSLQFGEDGADGKDGADGQNGKNGKDGQDGENGRDGVSIVNAFINENGHLIVVLSNGERIDAGTMGNLIPSDTPKTDYELAVSGGEFSGTLHQWLCSYNDGSRQGVSIADVQRNEEGILEITLNDGTVLNAGVISADGRISESVDEMGFDQRFELVILYHESGALNLRDKPDITNGAIVCSLVSGTELICTGSAMIGEGEDAELFYRFSYNGKDCYAKAKFFSLKYDTSAEITDAE